MTKPTRPKPPKHLSRASAVWYREVATTWELEAHHLRMLQLCCEAWDRGQDARETLAECGPTFIDRWGQPRAHPSVAIERDARVVFTRCLRELGLDIQEPGVAPQSPMITGRAGSRRA